MGVGASKKNKKKQAAMALLGKPAAPKPLTAVSEGEEHAWSSVHVEEDKEDDTAKRNAPQKNSTRNSSPVARPASSKHVEVVVETTREQTKSVEEKEEYPMDSSSSAATSAESIVLEEPTKSEPEPVVVTTEETYAAEPELEKQPEPQPEPEPEPFKQEDEPAPEPIIEVAPPREPTPDPLQEGGYLVFSTVSDGTLYLHFSYEKIEGAIAYFKPKKVVPAFKYRQNHGKVELIRKLLSNKQGYFAGYADYLKAAKEFDADVYMIQPVARLFYQVDTSTVYEAPLTTFVSSKYSSIAVIPPANTCFDGVKSLAPDQFISTGNKYGKALRF